ncbi:MAG: SDR family NAD(P)-dependent oxidoreductase [Acidobacteria bacterium]|nr:SDR family NAD(P)-dependent oxidoreductase [Acidobacteriota bacterium]
MQFKTKTLAQQVAIVTGGGTGIGRAFTEALAKAGTTVVIASRRKDVLHQTADDINTNLGYERVFPYAFDIRDFDQVEALVHYTLGRWSAVDLLINNSGLAVPEEVHAITEAGWDTVMDTNLRGAMRLVRAVLPSMTAHDFGDIINVASQAGKHGYADVPSYCASKFGLLGFAESLRDHLRKTGANIRVFNFCPGLVDVEHTRREDAPRDGFIHVANLARALLFVLSLDRNVVVEDLNLYSR